MGIRKNYTKSLCSLLFHTMLGLDEDGKKSAPAKSLNHQRANEAPHRITAGRASYVHIKQVLMTHLKQSKSNKNGNKTVRVFYLHNEKCSYDSFKEAKDTHHNPNEEHTRTHP